MKVVILAGGKGVRYDKDKPKALAMIGNKPIIFHLMDIYKQQGYNDFILCLGWKQDIISNYILNTENDYNIKCVDTGIENYTAKRIKLIESYIPKNDENFLCTYVDGLSNVDLGNLINKHLKNKKIVTLTAVRPINQFGILEFDNNNNIIGFKEKPKMNEFVNGGFFVFNKKIFNYIDLNKNQELEKDILTKLLEDKQLCVFKCDNENFFWETINNIKDEINLNNLYNKCMENNEKLMWLK